MPKKLSFSIEEETTPGNWVELKDCIDDFIVETDETDLIKLRPLAQEQIDIVWNSQLIRNDKPRRLLNVLSIENYIDPRRKDFDEDFWGSDGEMVDNELLSDRIEYHLDNGKEEDLDF